MAQLTRDTHTWGWDMKTRGHPRWAEEWRWLCGCGSRGRWQSQSPSASSYAWAKHAGVEPFNVDEYGNPE